MLFPIQCMYNHVCEIGHNLFYFFFCLFLKNETHIHIRYAISFLSFSKEEKTDTRRVRVVYESVMY